jgi:hypothetical protein
MSLGFVDFHQPSLKIMAPPKKFGPGTTLEDVIAHCRKQKKDTKSTSSLSTATVSKGATTTAVSNAKKRKAAPKKAPGGVVNASLSSAAESEGKAMIDGAVEVKPELQELKGVANFTEEKDLFLCKAFINVTSDSTVGCNQKGDTFLSKVHKIMYKLYDKQPEVVIPGRCPVESLKN